MSELIGGILIDLSIITGVVLLVMSLLQKYKERKLTLRIVGVLLLAVGIIFIDVSALSEAYQSGLEFGSN